MSEVEAWTNVGKDDSMDTRGIRGAKREAQSRMTVKSIQERTGETGYLHLLPLPSLSFDSTCLHSLLYSTPYLKRASKGRSSCSTLLDNRR